MKKWFALIALFLSSYTVFIAATVPISLLTNNVALPKNINLSGVTGTIWNAKIAQVKIDNITLEKVSTHLSFLSLISLSPEINITFGDALLSSPEGKLTVSLSSDELTLTNGELFVAANDVISQVALPLPATAQGNVDLTIDEMIFSYSENNFKSLACTKVSGELTWKGAGVIALEQTVKVGQFKANLSCENKTLLLVVDPNNDLGLSFSLYARMNQRLSGDGYLKPGAKFPQVLQSALPFLGKKDDQGRYKLKF